MSEHFIQIGQALAAGCSADASLRSNAEAYLKNAETGVTGYHTMLQLIYMNQEHDIQVRQLAAITFKNGIDRYWRKSAKNAIPEDEKQGIRQRLLQSSTCEASIRRQVSQSVAKVARTDYPSAWPTLFRELSELISAAQGRQDVLFAHLETLHDVVETMASLRIGSARAEFQTIAPTVARLLLTCYTSASQAWISGELQKDSIRISDTALAAATKVISSGFEAPHTDPLCRQFFILITSQIRPMSTLLMQSKAQSALDDEIVELMAKHLLHVGEFFLELSANSMDSYSSKNTFVLMPGSIEVVGTYWELSLALANSEEETWCQIVIQGLILLKHCIKLSATPEAHLRLMMPEEREVVLCSMQTLRQGLFNSTNLSSILEGLIVKFLVLSPSERAVYDDDPESWLNSQEESHSELDVRPCALKVTHDLFSQYKNDLTDLFMKVLRSTTNELTGEGLYVKEAMYNALGVAAPYLYESFDFDSFLDRLVEELTSSSVVPLFRRRVAILVAQWSAVKCAPNRKALVYQIVGSVMQHRSSRQDFGAALSAAFVVETLLNVWEFESEPFEPFAAAYIDCLLPLLADVTNDIAKTKILGAIGMIYDKIDNKTQTSLDLVLFQIAREWEKENEDYWLRMSLLGLLSKLTLNKRINAKQGYSVVIPLISFSTNVDNSEYTYLVEEGLELWHAIVQHAAAPDESLLQLLPILSKPNMLLVADDKLAKILSLVESNLLLFKLEQASLAVLQQLMHQVASLMSGLDDSALSHCTKVLALGVQILGAGCLSDAHLWSLTSLMLRDDSTQIVKVSILCLLSQITLSDLTRTTQLWRQSPEGDVTANLLKVIFESFDHLGQAKRRKACALALTAITTTQHSIFKDEHVLAGLGNIWSDVLAEVQPHAGNDLVYWVDESILLDDVIADSAEADRRRQLMDVDPVCTSPLRQVIRDASRHVDVSLLGVNLESFMH